MGDIDDVKARLNIVDIVGSRVALKKAGRNFKGLCPFHNEKTPSFMVSPDRQVFHCFGCGKGGSGIDFVMETEHLDFYEALETLASRVGVTLTHKYGDSPEHRMREKLYEVNGLAAEYYQYILTKHTLGEKAMLYLKNRGVSDKAIKTFSIGYSPNSWDALYGWLRKKGYSDEVIEKAGLVMRRQSFGSARGFYDRFRGRVMFALKDHRGNVAGFSGRVLDPTVKEAKYINSSETPVYVKGNMLFGLDVTKDAITKAGEAIVMEGEMDVISSFQAGVPNVVAIKGSALTEGHVALLKRFCERIVFCLDSDMAGDAASRRGIEIADKAGLDMRVAAVPFGKDPDEAAREDAVAFKKALKDAVPVYDYFIESAKKRFDMDSAFGKKKAAEEVLPVIAKIENTIVQAHYVKKWAGVLGVSEDTVITGMRKAIRMSVTDSLRSTARKDDEAAAAEEAEKLSAQEKLEVYVLGHMLQGDTKALFEEFSDAVAPADVKHAAVRRIVEALDAHMVALGNLKPFAIADFAASLPNELLPILDEANLQDLSAYDDELDKLAKEWMRALRELRKSIIRGKIRDATDRLRALPPDEESAAGLQRALSDMTLELKALEKTGRI